MGVMKKLSIMLSERPAVTGPILKPARKPKNALPQLKGPLTKRKPLVTVIDDGIVADVDLNDKNTRQYITRETGVNLIKNSEKPEWLKELEKDPRYQTLSRAQKKVAQQWYSKFAVADEAIEAGLAGPAMPERKPAGWVANEDYDRRYPRKLRIHKHFETRFPDAMQKRRSILGQKKTRGVI